MSIHVQQIFIFQFVSKNMFPWCRNESVQNMIFFVRQTFSTEECASIQIIYTIQ